MHRNTHYRYKHPLVLHVHTVYTHTISITCTYTHTTSITCTYTHTTSITCTYTHTTSITCTYTHPLLSIHIQESRMFAVIVSILIRRRIDTQQTSFYSS